MERDRVKMVHFSIIIPLLNEARSLRRLFFEIDSMLHKNNYSAEVIFVDDGSTDNSWEIIEELAGVNTFVKGIRLRRNFGKSIALKVGLEKSNGELIQIMDADLQHYPRDIPLFINKIASGFDLVNGWQQNRQAHLSKIVSSRFFNWLIRMISKTDLHDMNCGMKCFHRSLIGQLHLYDGLHRFIPLQAHSSGYKITEIPINSRPRMFGRSKYGFTRFFPVVMDIFTLVFLIKYGQKTPRPFNPKHYILDYTQ